MCHSNANRKLFDAAALKLVQTEAATCQRHRVEMRYTDGQIRRAAAAYCAIVHGVEECGCAPRSLDEAINGLAMAYTMLDATMSR